MGMQNDADALENSLAGLQKVKELLPQAPVIPLLGKYPSEMKIYIHTKTCTQMFTETLFTTALKWKQPKCLLTDK